MGRVSRAFETSRQPRGPRGCSRPGAWLVALACSAAGVTAAQPLEPAIEGTSRVHREEAAAQQRIERLDDERDALARRYREELLRIESLSVYNAQLEALLEDQEAEARAFRDELARITSTGREITPWLLAVLESLESFVAGDLPFLEDERRIRLERLHEAMGRADLGDAEKARRVLEAFQIEVEYGHTIESWQGEVALGERTLLVDFLRFGRLAFLFLGRDGREGGVWKGDAATGGWIALGASDRAHLAEAIRIARKQQAPDLVFVPVAPPEPAR